MATNLINELMDSFDGDALSRVASAIGEEPVKTKAALGAMIPAVIGGLADKVSTPERASGLLDLIRTQSLDSGDVTDPARVLTTPAGVTTLMNAGGALGDSLFGTRTTVMSDGVASLAGVGRSSSSSLMNLVLPLVLGVIAKHVKKGGWNATSLMSLLTGQREFLRDTPGLDGVLGTGEASVRDVYETEEVQGRPPIAEAVDDSPSRKGWLWALPLLLLIPLLGYLVSRSREPREAAVQIPASLAIPRSAPDPDTPVGTTGTTATFTAIGPFRLEFSTATGALTATSSEQLRDIVAIMKANPQARLEITGHSDNVGDEGRNMKLSRERADAVTDRIARLGIDRSRMTTAGHGDGDPVADNGTPEGRHDNRRVEIRITER